MSQGQFQMTFTAPSGAVLYEVAGAPTSGFLESRDLEFGSRRAFKFIDAILVELEEVSGAQVQIGYRDDLETPVSWQELVGLSEDALPVYLRLSNKYFKIRVASEDGKTFWRLSALEFFGNKFGESL